MGREHQAGSLTTEGAAVLYSHKKGAGEARPLSPAVITICSSARHIPH